MICRCPVCERGSAPCEAFTLLVTSGTRWELVKLACILTGICPLCGSRVVRGPLPGEVLGRWNGWVRSQVVEGAVVE